MVVITAVALAGCRPENGVGGGSPGCKPPNLKETRHHAEMGAKKVVATSDTARRYVEGQGRSGQWSVSASRRVLLKLEEIVHTARAVRQEAASSSRASIDDRVQRINKAWSVVIRVSVESLRKYRRLHPAKTEQAVHAFKRRLNPQGPLSRAIYDSLNYPACA
jgi:hypothetical protein